MDAILPMQVAGRRAAHRSAVAAMARFGLAARGIVYLMIGWLALQIALGHHTQQANQRGAMSDIVHHTLGSVIVTVLGLGLAAYALWRLGEAAFGTAAEGRRTGPRLKSLGRGIVYAALAVSTFEFLAGSSQQGQAQQQETTTAKLMRHTGGRWLVGLVGAVVVVIGVVLVVEGVKRKFERQLRMHELTGRTRSVVLGLGVVGTVARGIAFAIAGVLVVEAAWTFDPAKSTGLDGALRTLAARPFGDWLLGLISLGVLAFGLFSLAMARWAKVD